MSEEIPHDLVEIQDPEIDPDWLMEQIRERIRRRREERGYERKSFPSYGAAAYPGEPEGEDYDADLYYHLKRANRLYVDLGVDLTLAPSPMTRLPIVGRIWERVRREAHHLVLFYVGKLAQRQVTVNRHLVSTLNRLVVQLQEQQRLIRALEADLERLRLQGPAPQE